jgi:16S rRNA A1518/A1519 N6-dimethyltransferase RsmA/KsgA/DIM1 with predicted DNA glycosylase/AP lyase activity
LEQPDLVTDDPALAMLADPSWDQYFLTNEQRIAELLAAANIDPEDHVVEVGAGAGTVARHLPRSASLTLVELDPRLIAVLRENAPEWATIVRADALAAVDDLERIDILLANLPTRVTNELLPRLRGRGIRTVVAAVGEATDMADLDGWAVVEITRVSGSDFTPPQPSVSRLVRLQPLP